MIFWIDAQLPPLLAAFLHEQFGVEAHALRELGLRDAEDEEIFARARESEVVLVSKDADFVELIERLGPPPRLLWVTCGNISNDPLCTLFAKLMPDALAMLEAGETIIEIAGKEEE
jgi:predicted nuclease of predicted toxin-antitoxin system